MANSTSSNVVSNNNPSSSSGIRREIVILQRGWIVVGDVEQHGNYFIISDASVIHRWGTDKGLGQLALAGPTKDTILDPCGTVRVHELAVVGRIDVMSNSKGKALI